MNLKSNRFFIKLLLLLMTSLTLFNCSATRTMNISELETEKQVRLYLKDGQSFEGIITERSGQEVTIMAENDNQAHVINANNIRRVEPSRKTFDYQGFQISSAEIERNRTNRNAWGYGIGGGVVAGLVGLVADYPVWVANDNPPPLFVAGITAIVGSIYYASRGTKKDHQLAIQQVRLIHQHEYDLEQQKLAEEKRLQDLAAEKKALQKKLNEKKAEQHPNKKK